MNHIVSEIYATSFKINDNLCFYIWVFAITGSDRQLVLHISRMEYLYLFLQIEIITLNEKTGMEMNELQFRSLKFNQVEKAFNQFKCQWNKIKMDSVVSNTHFETQTG